MKKKTIKKKIKTAKQLGLYAAKLALEKKAFNVVLLDIRERHMLMDYILIVSAGSTKQAQTIAEFIKESLKKENLYAISIEGFSSGKWILMDYNDVIIHIFYEYVRDIYDLEGLWLKSKKVNIPKSYFE